MISHLLGEVNLLPAAIGLDLNQPAPGAVVRRKPNPIATSYGRGHIGHVVGWARVFPQKFAVTKIQAYRPASGKENNLRGTGNFDRNRGRITGFVALAFPDQRTISLFKGHDRSAGTSGVHQNFVSDHQRRFADAPLDIRSAELPTAR